MGRVSLAAILVLCACEQRGEASAPQARNSSVTAPTSPGPADTAPSDPVPAATVAQPDDGEPLPPAEPEEPKPPEDYGVIQPSDAPPDDAALTHHALAGYEVVAVYDKPTPESKRLGYLRIGSRLKVTAKVEGESCGKGWHQLPSGGYACASKGLVVEKGRDPYMHRPPPPPALDKPTPYEYAYVRRWNSPMYWRPPTAVEFAEAEKQRAIREAEREGKPPPGSEPAKPAGTATPAGTAMPGEAGIAGVKTEAPAPKDPLKELPSVDEKPKEAAPAKPAAEPTPAAPAEPPPPPPKLPLNPQEPWLEKGYYISIGAKIRDEGKSWWRTARGGYVQASAAGKVTIKDFVGQELDEEAAFPFGYVMAKDGSKLLELGDDGKLKAKGPIERRTFVDLTEEIEVNGREYMMTTNGRLIRKSHLRLADPQPLPEGLEEWEPWIDVSLSKQMLVAYEGSRPVFTTLVSTGKRGSKEEPFDTPTGRWRIRVKHISSTMDGNSASDGNYSIQDVPWAMFFHENIALHGAFWHNGYGRVRSHGCVNLGPSDARWLFNWTTPHLPEGWHGVNASEEAPGTTVVVRE